MSKAGAQAFVDLHLAGIGDHAVAFTIENGVAALQSGQRIDRIERAGETGEALGAAAQMLQQRAAQVIEQALKPRLSFDDVARRMLAGEPRVQAVEAQSRVAKRALTQHLQPAVQVMQALAALFQAPLRTGREQTLAQL